MIQALLSVVGIDARTCRLHWHQYTLDLLSGSSLFGTSKIWVLLLLDLLNELPNYVIKLAKIELVWDHDTDRVRSWQKKTQTKMKDRSFDMKYQVKSFESGRKSI